jgi:hypothetical protein
MTNPRVRQLLGLALSGLPAWVRADTGTTAILLTLLIPAFLAAGALAVDLASWYGIKRKIQTAADAAAYAAALEIAHRGLDQVPDITSIRAVAEDVAGRNGVVAAVTVHSPPLSGLAAADPQAVEIIVTQAAPVYFAGMFLKAAPSLTARAVAKAVVSDACIWALHPSARGGLTVAGTAEVDLDCGVVVNSDHEQALEQNGASCLSATSISVTGNYAGDCVSPPPEIHGQNYGDPLQDLSAPPVGTCDHATKVKVSGGDGDDDGAGPVILTPGVYCAGISIEGDVVFEPGLYVLKGGTFHIAGNARVTNNENASGGVTFYLTGDGSDYAEVDVASGAEVTLTPMTAKGLSHVLFFQDRDAPGNGKNKFTGQATMSLTGILYFPNQEVEFAGGSSADEADILLVASTITLTGNAYLHADYAKSLLPERYYARLVE